VAALHAGDLATWVGAFGTAGALFVSLWLVRKEQDSRRREKEAELRAQARKVAAWVHLTSRHAGVGASKLEGVDVDLSSGSLRRIQLVPPNDEPNTEAVSAKLEVVNRSDEPVYDCRVVLRLMSKGQKGEVALAIGVLGPSSAHKTPVRVLPTEPVEQMGIVADLEFVDTAGMRWHRSSDGYLRHVGFVSTAGVLREKLDGWTGPSDLPKWQLRRRFVRWRRLRTELTPELLRKIALR
jgi:hypothetical protein